MLQFRLFGYPVKVEWFFWILCLVLGMRYLDAGGSVGISLFLICTVSVFCSIIWHELGHAWARKKYGAEYSEIVLHGFGGLCVGPGSFTRKQSIVISAAGPLANLAVGGVVWLVKEAYPPQPGHLVYHETIDLLLWINVGWAIFNLLPLYPLDGGQIFASVAGPRNFRTVLWVGIILAVVLALYSYLVRGSLFGLILLGMLAWGNWQRLQGQRSQFL